MKVKRGVYQARIVKERIIIGIAGLICVFLPFVLLIVAMLNNQ